MVEISNEMQQKLQEYQEAQERLKLILSQKYQIELNLKEAKNALKEVEQQEKAEIYKIVGQILIRYDKGDIVKELKDKIETNELRLKTIAEQEKKLSEKLKSIQDGFQGSVGSAA